MNPYLESLTHWSDFHSRLVNALADAINDPVPPRYVARINEHVMAITPTTTLPEDASPVFVPDVTVLASNTAVALAGDVSASASTQLQPVVMENVRYVDDYTEAYLELVRLPEMQVVTVLELLSPTNKYGEVAAHT